MVVQVASGHIIEDQIEPLLIAKIGVHFHDVRMAELFVDLDFPTDRLFFLFTNV